MAIKRITLTEDLLKVIPAIRFKKLNISDSDGNFHAWGIDTDGLFGGSYILEDIAKLIGRYDEHIQGTEYDSDGMKFTKETSEYLVSIYDFIVNNLEYIESLVHQYVCNGGLTVGTYKCKDYEMFWTKES